MTVPEAVTSASLAIAGRLTPGECGASAILAAGGPTAVPFHLCCALTIIHAGGPDPVPLVCGALESGHDGGLDYLAALACVAEPTP
jgi:hypothetical protein